MRATGDRGRAAGSDQTVVAEGNPDVPAEDVHGGYVEDRPSHPPGPGKGGADSPTGVVDRSRSPTPPDAGWHHPVAEDGLGE